MWGIQKGWSRVQVQDHLKKFRLSLTISDDRHSVAESLVVCLIQHSSRQYSSLTRIKDAVEFFLQTEEDQIRFRLRLSEKLKYTPASSFKSLVKDILSLIQQFDSKFPYSRSITVIGSHGIVKIRLKDGQELQDLFLWQDGQSGLFSCITERRNTYKDDEDYALALLRDIPLIRDLLFHHLELMEDEEVEEAALNFADKLQSCQTSGEYLAAINQCNIVESDRWKLIALEEFVNLGHQLPEEIERDLKEEIMDCLARASEDTILRRKTDYETACQKDVERENEKERHNRQLKEEMEATRKEIEELEANIEETRKRENETQKEYEKRQSHANAKKERELKEKAIFQRKSAEIRQKQEELRNQKAEAEAQVKRIQKEENRAQENAKKATREIDLAGNRLDSVHHTVRRRRADLEEYKKNIARLEKEQLELSLYEQQIMTENQRNTEQNQKKLQNVKTNQAKIQKLKAMKEMNAWREFQVALNGSIPPYQLVTQKNSFLNRVNGINQLDRLIQVVNSELKLEIRDYEYLISYARNLGTAEDLNKLRNIVWELLNESNYDFTRPPWRISGCALLLSQVKEQMPKKHCEEIHICASRVIYVDCDWTIPGTNVTLSAPRIEIVGAKRTIDTSGRNATEFVCKKADNANRNGENGDHGRNGAAGESAGNFFINCAHLSGGTLEVVANGGKGADGQDGGDGKEGTSGADGQDGEITDRPSEGIGFINAGFRSSDSLHRFSRGRNGTAGQAGGSGGNGGVGGQGGRKGVVTSTIMTTLQRNFNSIAQDGADGKDGNPGQGASGGWGGRNGRDRALVFEPNDGLVYTGDWKEACGDLELRACKNILGCILGYRISKRSENKGRASNGTKGENGKKGDQRQRATADATKKITNAQHIWNNDVLRQQQSSSTDTIDAELAQMEAKNRQAQNEIAQQEAEINNKLKLVKQKKSAVDQNMTRESSAAIAAQREASQLEEEETRIHENIQQQKNSVLRNQLAAETLKTDAEKRKTEVEQLTRFAAEHKASSDLEIGQVKAVLSRATEEAKAAERAAETTRQLADNIKSDRIKTERAVQKDRNQVEQCTKTVARNEIGMEEDRQHRMETERKLQKLDGLSDLKERILKKARIVQQIRTERIAVLEGNTIPDVEYEDPWPSGLELYLKNYI